MFSKVLRTEKATPRVCGMLYRVTVQAVLLYGSKTWVMLPASVWTLEGFHIYCACQLTGMVPSKRRNGTRKYPKLEAVLKATSLWTIEEYINVRRQRVASYIVHRPINIMCQGVEQLRGTTSRQFWWEQNLDVATVRATAPDSG